MLFFQQTIQLLCFFFISHSRSLSPFCCWAWLVCCLLSLFLCLSLALYSKFVGMTINVSLIVYTTRIQKQFPLSVFVFIYSLVVTRVAMWFPAKITSTCIWVAIPVDRVWCGRTVGGSRCTVTWIPNFLGWGDLLTHGAPLARASCTRELCY